jgi:hypothetical protein
MEAVFHHQPDFIYVDGKTWWMKPNSVLYNLATTGKRFIRNYMGRKMRVASWEK